MRQRREERVAKSLQGVTTIVRIEVRRPSIEKGIAFVPRRRMHSWEYPYEDMKIGDSFHVMVSETSNPIVSTRVHSHNKHNPDTKFSCRTQVDEHGNPLTRVWRVK
jgi:hypothetical protein